MGAYMEYIMEFTGLSETALAEITGFCMGIMIASILGSAAIIWAVKTSYELLGAAAEYLIRLIRKHIRKHR